MLEEEPQWRLTLTAVCVVAHSSACSMWWCSLFLRQRCLFPLLLICKVWTELLCVTLKCFKLKSCDFISEVYFSSWYNHCYSQASFVSSHFVLHQKPGKRTGSRVEEFQCLSTAVWIKPFITATVSWGGHSVIFGWHIKIELMQVKADVLLKGRRSWCYITWKSSLWHWGEKWKESPEGTVLRKFESEAAVRDDSVWPLASSRAATQASLMEET